MPNGCSACARRSEALRRALQQRDLPSATREATVGLLELLKILEKEE